jgi:hypothetical protein
MLEEEEVPGKGVGLRLRQGAAAGTVLLEEEPVAWAVCPDLAPRLCRGCCAVADACFEHTSLCLGCRAAYYCSVACRAADAARHASTECRVLGAYYALRHQWAEEMGSDDETFLLCLLGLVTAPEAQRAAVGRLMGLPGEDPSLEGLREAASLVLSACGLAALLPEPAAWAALCAAEQCNAFGLFDAAPESHLHCFGRAVFVAASRFNHSCAPSVARVRRGRRLLFAATRDVAAGEEAAVTYVSLGVSRDDRRAELLGSYGFACDCVRCRAEEESKEDSGQQWVCDACGGEQLLGRCVHHSRAELLEQLG